MLKRCVLLAVFALLCTPVKGAQTQTAIFAGGCFWCMEPPYDKLDGVTETISGYTGGDIKDPSYEQVSRGNTGHREAVLIRFDPDKVSYEELLEVFWRNIDPLDEGGQFCDRGFQYTSAIYVDGAAQRKAAEASLAQVKQQFEKDLVTPIVAAEPFFPAEDYHQNYYQRNPIRYKYYRYSCGRDDRLEELWSDDD